MGIYYKESVNFEKGLFMYSIGTGWMWAGFFIFVLFVLTIDMFFLGGKRSHRVTTKEALCWTGVWVSCALIFNFLLWLYLQHTESSALANEKALEFFTGYFLEESLSVDNMFVFLMIFQHFAVPAEYQRRVLLYGVLGAIVLRLIMIVSGTWLVSKFHWVLYLFGFFLLVTGIKMLFSAGEEKNLADNVLLNAIRRRLRVTEKFHNEKFFVRQHHYWYATPLFLVLIMIEISDLIFALDSIPAVFAVTNDPFIVFTSNIFAILGLRALYFLLAGMAARFYLLKYGIAIMLTWIGTKMLVAPWIDISILLTLSVVVAILGTTVVLSVLVKPGRRRERK
jgi:tellurite resistance protein TerC